MLLYDQASDPFCETLFFVSGKLNNCGYVLIRIQVALKPLTISRFFFGCEGGNHHECQRSGSDGYSTSFRYVICDLLTIANLFLP